ncbi:MAG: hypothetical protein IPO00_17910 [Betaproteobacteria bacterium]|nr:hypothetical protein [Betaproteobacteria bacterium]
MLPTARRWNATDALNSQQNHASLANLRLTSSEVAAAPAPASEPGACASPLSIVTRNEAGVIGNSQIRAERALTIYLDKRELVTMMTLGAQPGGWC